MAAFRVAVCARRRPEPGRAEPLRSPTVTFRRRGTRPGGTDLASAPPARADAPPARAAGRRRRTWLGAVAVAVVATLALTPAGSAAPQQIELPLRYGIDVDVGADGCVPATLVQPLGATSIRDVNPRMNLTLIGETITVVQEAVADGTTVRWTVAPHPVECELHAHEPRWRWRTGVRSWWVTYRAPVYAALVSPHGGVRSLAGLRVAGGPGGRPTLARARRVLGSPSRLVRRDRGRAPTCAARWAPLGLTIAFAADAPRGRRGHAPARAPRRPPCARRRAVRATVSGAAATTWAVRIGRRPGIVVGTSASFLADRGHATGGPGRWWTLAARRDPADEHAEARPTVLARATAAGALRALRFELATP